MDLPDGKARAKRSRRNEVAIKAQSFERVMGDCDLLINAGFVV
jgi:hypothetical protein